MGNEVIRTQEERDDCMEIVGGILEHLTDEELYSVYSFAFWLITTKKFSHPYWHKQPKKVGELTERDRNDFINNMTLKLHCLPDDDVAYLYDLLTWTYDRNKTRTPTQEEYERYESLER